MKKIRILSVTVLCLFMTISIVFSADIKIVTVDMMRLIKAHPKTKFNISVLEEQINDFEVEQKDMLAEREKLKDLFEIARKETRNKALSEEEQEKKMRNAEKRLADIRDYEFKIKDMVSTRQKELSDLKIRMRRRIVSDIKKIIDKYANKKGFKLVLDSSNIGINGVNSIVYSKDKIDITEDILERINDKKK